MHGALAEAILRNGGEQSMIANAVILLGLVARLNYSGAETPDVQDCAGRLVSE